MNNEKWARKFRDLDVWMKQSSGFGEDIKGDYDFENGDVHESFIKVFVTGESKPATIIRNKCKESIEHNTYCGDSIEVHNEYVEITKGTSNKDLVTLVIPFDKITLVISYSSIVTV